MRSLARFGVLALTVTYMHLVFGGIVRITGSGMGCGDHWPKCNGSWVPPFRDATVMIEWTHRLLALLVILSIALMAVSAWRRRAEPGVAGTGGVLRPAISALVLVVAVALVGMVTVKLGNTTLATVAHWTLATALLAVLVIATVRAGGLGGAAVRNQGGSARAARSIGAGALLAFAAVVMGGLVAKFPGAGVACPGFPLCGSSPSDLPAGASHVQLTHRVIAYLLVFHVLAISSAIRRRQGESPTVKRVLALATGLVLLQIALGAGMVLSALPPALRVSHQLVGIGVWLALFLAAYLSRTAAAMGARAGDLAMRAGPTSSVPRPLSHES
jgi:heme A synthase